ncbi:MAG: hypothetical protein KF849_11525 [Rhizobiaceae bacterium]|nr:hypothetical protein [Rhizobiaceae bacterium]
MRIALLASSAMLATISALVLWPAAQPAAAYEVEKYHVYCADDRIEVSFWDREQMIVRRGNPVCLFATYTSRSSALTFAEKNFGGEGKPCFCE